MLKLLLPPQYSSRTKSVRQQGRRRLLIEAEKLADDIDEIEVASDVVPRERDRVGRWLSIVGGLVFACRLRRWCRSESMAN